MKKFLLVIIIGFVLATLAAIGAPQPLASPAVIAQAECDCSNLEALQIELRNAMKLQQAAAQHPTASTPAVRSPEIVLKEFYKWYIHDVNGQGSNSPWKTTKGRVILKKYVTLRFIRAIDRNEKRRDLDAFDGDYFLLEQDTSGYTGKYISVSKVAIKGPTATAIVSFFRGDDRGLRVSLIKEGGGWKIDKVKDESGVGLVK